ncbi:two-partner secretion domain-containing protein [Mastigocladopsis repens]|uniref:two-partner secretion domain-containing protein n=1 Tax=Mastigocladopsis repens TaxID=221287 RepID=UPI000301B734|nr:filamentous hemagglutinin N-terminal domain-containing protein [Mastigocladopsis repens]
MTTLASRFKGLGITIGAVIIAFSTNSAIAQVTPDATLPDNSRVTTQDNLIKIEGGTQAGSNLFHSFKQFSVPTGTTALFNNASNVENIISRVTGNSISEIYGTLAANGTANLFLINPNGIIFGPNATLNIGGSFIASTASSLNFADGTKFSATDPQSTPLLTVSVPIGLQFGANPGSIRNQSQASPEGAISSLGGPVGLQVKPGKTLALVGSDVTLDGGNLTAEGGEIELGSVAGNSLVTLNPTSQGWALSYEGVQNFQNIQLVARTVDGSEFPSYVDASGEGGGRIQVQSKGLLLTDGSRIWSLTLGSQSGKDLIVNASESVELVGLNSSLANLTMSTGDGGDLTINTQKLSLRDGAQISTGTVFSSGSGGNLTVNASESVDLIGEVPVPNTKNNAPSVLTSATAGSGNAGDITINTSRLRIQDGAEVSAESTGVLDSNVLTPGIGQGGNLTVNASESIELVGISPTGIPSRLTAATSGSGDAGKLTITTGQLIVRDGAAVTVSSEVPDNYIYNGHEMNFGRAGELNITARSIRLDNQGKITSETDLGQGGDINIQLQDLLLLRRNSQISTNAGNAQAGGDGGNISINTPNGFIVAVPGENSDITANAFTGSGGKIQINVTGIFGIVPRFREDLARLLGTNDPPELNTQELLTSDITAISQANPTANGEVILVKPYLDINRGLINLLVEPREPRLAQGCDAGVAQNQSEFIITGRGGIPPNPREILRSNNVQVDWVSLEGNANYPAKGVQSREIQGQGSAVINTQNNKYVNPSQNKIVEAQGWVVDGNGDVILVAQIPTVTPYSSWFNSASCSGR